MREAISTKWRRVAAALALACAAASLTAAGASAEEYNKEYEHALSVGTQAYVYGQPLLDMQRVYQGETSVTVPDQFGDAPVNQFSHFSDLATTKEGIVVAPNADTLYSIAWLQLKPQPIVVHVPTSSGRFNVVPLMTPYTENFADIGEGASGLMAPGNYVIAGGKKYAGVEEVDGMKVIHSPYERVWIIQRTLVNRIQGSRQQAGEDPMLYWAALGAALKQFKPPAADQPELELRKSVGIGPGKFPANNAKLSPGTLAGLRAAVAAGPGQVTKELTALFQGGFTAHNGWLVTPVGTYGTDYSLRAIADKIGLGALPPNIAIYPVAQTERAGHPLNGASTRYVAHLPASDFPVPAQAFWSMTMYEASGFFVANLLERFTLGDRSNLHYNEDGSLDIYLQSGEPVNEEQQSNWLPAPAGP
jgi:hypothetical protein